MFPRAFLLLVVACIQCTRQHHEAEHSSEPLEEVLSEEDLRFCSGELKLTYPGVTISSCMIIPPEIRRMISQDWKAPLVMLTKADQNKNYTLIMVDPDAPSRIESTQAHWRHWLMADIKGSSLRKGHITGTELSEYTPPTPPKGSGFHRYQFLVYKQPKGQVLSLSQKEQLSRGKWNLDMFVERFELVGPVATLQFLSQHFDD